MKTMNIFKSLAILSATVLLCAVACEEPKPVEPTPVFPDLVENMNVAPGDTLAVTFIPNLDWELTVPEETMDFFWIIDGSFQYSKLSGKASENPVTVFIGVSEVEDFTNRTTSVSLTMGGETRVIAEFMRPGEEYSLQMYASQVDEDGAFMFDEQGEYVFGETQPETLKMIWTGADFRIRIRVTSNFDWSISLPEWAEADIPEKRVGSYDFNVYGIPSKYPLEKTAGKIVFKADDKNICEYNLEIPGCSDILTYGVEIVSSINFNDAGQYLTPVRFIDGPVNAWIEGVKDVKVLAVEKKNDKYDVDGNGADWLDLSIAEYDESSTADVLQHRNVQISLAEYTADTEALVFFLPPTGWNTVADLFNEDASAVKDEWMANAVTVTAKSYGYLTLADHDAFVEGGGQMEVSDDTELKRLFGAKQVAQYAYVMTYTDQYASDNGRLLIKEAYSSVKVYDSTVTEIEDDNSDFFLSFTADEENQSGVINMSGEIKNTGYVVFRNEKDKVVAIVHCKYEPVGDSGEKDMLEDITADASRYFTDPEAAAAIGASMIEYVMGPTRYDCEEARNEGAVLLKMKCPLRTHVEINVPAKAKMVTAYPKDSFTLGGESMGAGGVYLESSTLDVYFDEFPANFKGIPSIKFHTSGDVTVLVIYIEVVE